MRKPVYIFDVDGVVNNLAVHDPDKRVITQIAELLNDGFYVAINTGRGYPWVKENIIDIIRSHTTADKLHNVFVSAEMGGVTVEFADGTERDERTAFSITPGQIEQVKQVFDKHKSKNIAWYEGKVSMATIYKPAESDVAAFAEDTRNIVAELQGIFADRHIKINANPDAIDVTTPEAGKWAGAQLIHDWLQRTPAASAELFVCFGDNASDYEMARFFGRQGHTVEFVFTGENLGNIEHDPQVTLTKTDAPYSDGTYNFLVNHKASKV